MHRLGLKIAFALTIAGTWASAVSAAELSDTMPAGTLLYIGWPGADALGQASKDTAWGKLMAEAEIVSFADRWHKEIWPALDRLMRRELGRGEEAELYEPIVNLLSAAWQHPTALGVAGVGMGPQGPSVDIALLIRAGADSKQLADGVQTIVKMAIPSEATEAKVGGGTLQEVMLPGANLPLRYGVLGNDFVITIGTKFSEHWAAGSGAETLTKSERFAAAMKATHGSSATPVIYVDLQGVITTLNTFQPMFAAERVPILGEPEGLKKLLDGLGLGSIQSLSVTMRPEAGGFVTSSFLHAPGLGEGLGAMFVQKPLTDSDLKLVPCDVTYATVCNFDLAGLYKAAMSAVKVVSPDVHGEIVPHIEEFENHLGVKIEQDLLGSFGDTWAIYDAPENGGIWFTGITVLGELKPGNKLDASLDKIVKAIADAVGEEYLVSIREEQYRGQKIRYVNAGGVPMPVAPAWTTVGDHWVFALYPQMVRTAIDQLAAKGPTLLDNPDFQRGLKQMPAGYTSINYTDTVSGIRFLHSLAIPIGATLMSMAQGEGIPLDASLLPSSKTLTKHLFGNVSTSVTTKDGVLNVSYGAIPIPIPAVGGGGGVAGVAMMAGIALPALASARQNARQVVGMNNLRQIAMGCILYAEAHKGVLPPDLETLTNGDNPLLSERMLKSPLDSSTAKSSYGYVKGQTNTMDPRNVIAFEDPKLHADNDFLMVAFLDGHVQRMTHEQFEEALQETKERVEEAAK